MELLEIHCEEKTLYRYNMTNKLKYTNTWFNEIVRYIVIFLLKKYRNVK